MAIAYILSSTYWEAATAKNCWKRHGSSDFLGRAPRISTRKTRRSSRMHWLTPSVKTDSCIEKLLAICKVKVALPGDS